MNKKNVLLWIFAITLGLTGCGGGGQDQDVTNYSSCGNLPSYAGELGRNLRRWRSFPVTVKIDLGSAPRVAEGNNRDKYMSNIKLGAQAWRVAGDGRIGDVVFVDSDDADIIIKFGTTPSAATLGETLSRRDNASYFVKGTVITLSILGFDRFISNNSWSTIFGSPSFDYTLYQIVAHEMGHALFASGHSSQAEDIMCEGFRPLTPGAPFLSMRDINTVREAYCRSPGS